MPRFRDSLDIDTIYTDQERAFITPDGLGGYWGEGSFPLDNLQDEHGTDVPVVEVDYDFMEKIAEDA